MPLLRAEKPWRSVLIFFSRYDHGHRYPVKDGHIAFRWFRALRRYWNNNTTLPISDVHLRLFGRAVLNYTPPGAFRQIMTSYISPSRGSALWPHEYHLAVHQQALSLACAVPHESSRKSTRSPEFWLKANGTSSIHAALALLDCLTQGEIYPATAENLICNS